MRALNEHRVRIEQLKGRLQTLDGRKVGEVSRFQTEAAQALADAVDEHETLLAQRESLNARFQEYQITSPVAGTIGRLHVNNFGEVLTPGALVAEIIPDGVPIVFYGRLRESDLPDVAVGQRARVTLSFMDTRTEKPLDAAVRSIDPDVTEEEDGSRYYAVVLQFDAERADARLFVGSGGSAFLITGKRTVLSYLFEPIYDVFTRALREN